MNLRRLEYFLTLAQVGHLRKASEMLHISPPALSKAISTLEDEIGINLFIKNGRSIILTDAGKQLYKQSQPIIESLKSVKENIAKKSSSLQTVKIATFEVFSTYFLSFLDKLDWNEHKLQLHETLPGELENLVLQSEVDLGITYMPMPNKDLDFLKVTSIEMGVYVKKGAFQNVQQSEIPFVVPVSPIKNTPSRVRGLDGWPEDAYQRKVLHEVTLMQSALELCSQGRVAGYFPCFVVNEYNQHVRDKYQLERKKSPYAGRTCKSDVYLVKRKSDEESAIAKQLAKAIRINCQS